MLTFNKFLPFASSLQKAKKAYNIINSYLYYNPFGMEIYNEQEKYSNVLKEIMSIQIDLQNSPISVVCMEWANIYSKILTELGIINYELRNADHGFVIFEIDNKYYLADATMRYGNKRIDLVSSKLHTHSRNFFEIPKHVYFELKDDPSKIDLYNSILISCAENFKNLSIELDKSIGETIDELNDILRNIKELEKNEEYRISGVRFRIERVLEKYIFPELPKYDLLTAYYWIKCVISNVITDAGGYKMNISYNSGTGQSALIIKVDKLKYCYIYRERSNNVDKIKVVDIQNEGYNYDPSRM